MNEESMKRRFFAYIQQSLTYSKSHYMKKYRNVQAHEILQAPELLDYANDYELSALVRVECIEVYIDNEQLAALVSYLSPLEKVILLFKFVYRMKYAQIGEMLEIDKELVDIKYRRILKKLRGGLRYAVCW